MCMFAAGFYILAVMNYKTMRFVTETDDETKSNAYKRKMKYVRFFVGIIHLIAVAVFLYLITKYLLAMFANYFPEITMTNKNYVILSFLDSKR